MKEFGEEHGITIELGVLRYSDNGFHVKIEGRKNGTGTKFAEDYNFYRKSYGFPVLGTKIEIAGNTYTVEGWRRSARKNKIQVKRFDGRIFVISIPQLKNAIIR